MTTIIAPATGLPTQIPDAPTVNTEDRPASGTGGIVNGVYTVYGAGYTSLSPQPANTTVVLDTVTVTAPRQYPVKNPLLDYDSYTYSLSLHGCSIEDYNNLVGNPDGFVPKQVLIAGAGRYSDTFPRNKYFDKPK